MKRLIVYTLLVFTTQLQAETIDLKFEGLKALLEERNDRLQALKLEKEASVNREGFAGRSFLPTLQLYGAQESFKIGRQNVKSQPAYGAEMKVNLFNGGRDWLRSELNYLNSEKKIFEYDRVLSDELQSVRKLYWSVLYLNEYIVLSQMAIETNTQNLKAASRRIYSGVATESDRVEFEMKEVDLQRQLSEAQLNLASALSDMHAYFALNADDKLVFNQKLEHEHDYADQVKHNVRDHDFLYKEQQLSSEMAVQQSEINKRGWWPSLDAYASYNQFNEREEDFADAVDRTESAVGVRLSFNFGVGFESAVESRSLTLEARAAERIVQLKRREIETHIETEIAELKFLHAQVHSAEENIRRAERYYKLTQSEYARGVKNSPDVLGASDKLLDTQLKYFETVRDFQITKSHILSKIGR
jgi:outer membrane protein